MEKNGWRRTGGDFIETEHNETERIVTERTVTERTVTERTVTERIEGTVTEHNETEHNETERIESTVTERTVTVTTSRKMITLRDDRIGSMCTVLPTHLQQQQLLQRASGIAIAYESMFPQHKTLHKSIAGYQDGVEFMPGSGTRDSPPLLHLVGWAFHWKSAACPVRYCRAATEEEEKAGGVPDAMTKLFTMRPRADVYEAYSRYAVLNCGWDLWFELPYGTTADDCPEQWLEMFVPVKDGDGGEWVKFRELVRFLDDEPPAPPAGVAGAVLAPPSPAPHRHEEQEQEQEGEEEAAALSSGGGSPLTMPLRECCDCCSWDGLPAVHTTDWVGFVRSIDAESMSLPLDFALCVQAASLVYRYSASDPKKRMVKLVKKGGGGGFTIVD